MLTLVTPTTRALLAEVVGTFFFVTLGAGAILANAASGGQIGIVGIALAHGVALAVAVSIFGTISGAHFNPAVSFGLALGGAFPWARVVPYSIAQVIGAVAAGLLLRAVFLENVQRATRLGTPFVTDAISEPLAALVEAVLTFFLLLAVFGTAVSPNAPRIAGFGIGLTVMVDILMGGPLTGAAMNPARYLGPAIAAGSFPNWWVYLAGPLAGGALGGLVWAGAFARQPAGKPR
jgi:MIP family channel proteins